MGFIYQIVIVAITSFYIFPIEFRFLPTVNTKMIMAVLGVVLFIINSIFKPGSILSWKIINVALCAFLVSFVGIISVLFNDTNDYTYALYFVSFLVWISAAYFVVGCIIFFHGYVSVKLVVKYLIAVAIAQCFLAILIDQIVAIKDFVNSNVVGFASMFSAGDGLEKAGRLYGIGAALDVAGTRFCAILSMIGIMVYESYLFKNKKQMVLYVVLFTILFVVGSMISRTTGIALFFLCIYYMAMSRRLKTNRSFWWIATISLSLLVMLVVVLYKTNTFFNENLQFAFEGFFNYWETGLWRSGSTETLKEMYILPESLRTWIIGDGYFDNPYFSDPYYVGESDKGLFYMGTDVGYLRFIYYFGMIGTLAFVIYFIVNTKQCVSKFPRNKWFFYALLMMNLMIWLKVSTDIFCVFALFLCIPVEENDKYEERLMFND